jgi:SOS-response transcriptional repressor LexA
MSYLTNTKRIDASQYPSYLLRWQIADMDKHQRLRHARIKAGYESAAAAARAMNIPQATLTSHENTTRSFDEQDAQRYARFFHTSPEWLLFGKGPDHIDAPLQLAVVGEVRAGAWLEVDGEPEVVERIPVAPDSRWVHCRQFALQVVGTSMNKVAQPGDYVIVASWSDMGTELQDDDLVVVKRLRGTTYEVTLKRARQSEKGWQLWPESSDPRWQTPLKLEDGDNDVEVVIIGRVIGIYKRVS